MLGGCVSIISKNVHVSVKLLNEHCKIVKILGEKYLYNHALEPHVFKTEIMQLLCDKEYTYVLEINLDEEKIKKDEEILYVEVSYKDMNLDNKLVKKKFMYKIESNEVNKDKANEEYIRSQVYYILDEALKLREKNKNKEANDLLANMEDWIKKNYKGNNTFYLEDIQKAKTLFIDEEIFEKKGKAFAKSNIKQKMHKKIGANDMYRNCNMDYYCKNIDDRDLEIIIKKILVIKIWLFQRMIIIKILMILTITKIFIIITMKIILNELNEDLNIVNNKFKNNN